MKKINLAALIYTGVGSIVGSGWLMSSMFISQTSGPSALLSWIFGGLIIAIIAFNFIEICSLLPTNIGGFGHYVEYTHNGFSSFISEWVFLLSWIGLIPAEATASVQYLSSFSSSLTHIVVDKQNHFTYFGTFLASIMCLIYFIINYLSLGTLMRFIKYLTLFKIIVPIVVAITLISATHHLDNLGLTNHNFMPYGFHGLLTAITTGGVVFAFIGFQTPVTFAEEAQNPNRNIPIAIISSVVFCVIIYTSLQLAYLLAIPPEHLINGGWNNIKMAAPFIELSRMSNLHGLVLLLLGAAFLSPFGAGLIFNASTARISRAFGNYLPKFVMSINKKGVPVGALYFVLIVCLLILWVLPAWQLIISIVCTGLVLLFAIMCIVNGSLNNLMISMKVKHGIRLKGSKFFSLAGFIFSSLMFFWSCWPLTGEAALIIFASIPLYLYFHSKIESLNKSMENLKKGSWLLAYIISMIILSYLSPFGGKHLLSHAMSQILVVIVATIFYFIGISKGHVTDKLKAYVASLG